MESQQSHFQTPLKTQRDHPKIALSSPPRPLLETDLNQDSPPNALTNEPMKKIGAPDRLRVPVALKYPERYRSPTDAMVSPITKGLLARNRKTSGSLIPPSFNLTKFQVGNQHKPESSLSSVG